MKNLKISFLIAFAAAILSFGCQKQNIIPEPEYPPIGYKTTEVVIPENIAFEALYDSCEVWENNGGGMNVVMENGGIVFSNSTSSDSINYVFNIVTFNDQNVGINEIEAKSGEDFEYFKVDVILDNPNVLNIKQYAALAINSEEIRNIEGSVTVSYELSAAEEDFLVNGENNNVSITNNGTNVLFNNPDVPVTDAVIAYYGTYFTEERSPYVLSTPDEQTEMGDVTRNELHTNTTPVEGEKYFKNGNYNTNYDPDGEYWDRMQALSNIRQDTTYFNNTWTSDSTSYRDVNSDYITNLVLDRQNGG